MSLSASQSDNHGGQGSNNEAGVDHEVGEENEPSVAVAFLELTGRLGACHRASGATVD